VGKTAFRFPIDEEEIGISLPERVLWDLTAFIGALSNLVQTIAQCQIQQSCFP
jgi:hypothetical protein